jgi:hypothetical protein
MEPSRPYTLERAPDLPPGVDSMMRPPERDILFSIAKHYYKDKGDIIDAGLYLGASTFCFVEGLRQNPAYKGRRVRAYERAIVNPAMVRDPAVAAKIGPVNSDYSGYLRSLLAPIAAFVDLEVGDILEKRYKGTVEILFLDILKTRRVFQHCNDLFMGSLIPGHSIVIQQDYYWHLDWYINAYMELLADYFEIVDSAVTSCVFLNTKPIPEQFYKADPLRGLRGPGIVRLLERSRNRAGTLFQYLMSELCIVDYMVKSGLKGAASERMDEFDTQFARVMKNCAGTDSFKRVANAVVALKRQIAAPDKPAVAGRAALQPGASAGASTPARP